MMKRRIYPLMAVGITAIAINILAFVLILSDAFAHYLTGGARSYFFPDELLSALGFLSGSMMLLYLLCSILCDREVDRKRALASWGMVLFTAVFGSVFYSMHFSLPSSISQQAAGIIAVILLFLPVVPGIAAIVMTARGISEKANGFLYLIASVFPMAQMPLCALFAYGMDKPDLMLCVVPISSLLFSIFVVLDLICYCGLNKKAQ